MEAAGYVETWLEALTTNFTGSDYHDKQFCTADLSKAGLVSKNKWSLNFGK